MKKEGRRKTFPLWIRGMPCQSRMNVKKETLIVTLLPTLKRRRSLVILKRRRRS